MDESLKQHLLEMEARLTAKIEGVEVRLGARIGAVEARLDAIEARLDAVEARLGAVEARLDAVEARLGAVEARLEATEARLNEKIEKVETALLTEFHKWASPAEARVRSYAATLRALDLEVEYMKDRLERLERNAGLNPLSS